MTYQAKNADLAAYLDRIKSESGLSESELSQALGYSIETIRQITSGAIEINPFAFKAWVEAAGHDFLQALQVTGLLSRASDSDSTLPALPVPGSASDVYDDNPGKQKAILGTSIEMQWRGESKYVFLECITADQYKSLEAEITSIYSELNLPTSKKKNRQAILEAMQLAIYQHPSANPSDLYHHVVYRLYLREYKRTQADRSWVRAGGEAFELFLQDHYNKILQPKNINIVWLSNEKLKSAALNEMGIAGEVGGSKLDIAIYGTLSSGQQILFAGIHAKASLAERVSDDVPCSETMMAKGYASYLITLDAKSFPPPNGDLINKGELGSATNPSDKRLYVESHGSFSACFSYNTRTSPSPTKTASGNRIYSSTFANGSDPFPRIVETFWNDFKKLNKLR